MPQATYELSSDTLSVRGTLEAPLDIQFDLETRAFIDTARAQGVVDAFLDVRGVGYMGSQYIGALAAVAAELKKDDITLTIRARDKVADLLCQCGLDRLMQLVID